MSREAIEPCPSIGMAATLCYYTDRQAGTVIAVSPSKRKITIREDKATRTDGGPQDYAYTEDPEGRIHVCYLQGDGRYKSTQGPSVVLGHKRSYYDFGF